MDHTSCTEPQYLYKGKPRGGGGVSGSYNKRVGCSASGVYAPGPDEEEEEVEAWNSQHLVCSDVQQVHTVLKN
jgi:hypothetical protein